MRVNPKYICDSPMSDWHVRSVRVRLVRSSYGEKPDNTRVEDGNDLLRCGNRVILVNSGNLISNPQWYPDI